MLRAIRDSTAQWMYRLRLRRVSLGMASQPLSFDGVPSGSATRSSGSPVMSVKGWNAQAKMRCIMNKQRSSRRTRVTVSKVLED